MFQKPAAISESPVKLFIYGKGNMSSMVKKIRITSSYTHAKPSSSTLSIQVEYYSAEHQGEIRTTKCDANEHGFHFKEQIQVIAV